MLSLVRSWIVQKKTKSLGWQQTYGADPAFQVTNWKQHDVWGSTSLYCLISNKMWHPTGLLLFFALLVCCCILIVLIWRVLTLRTLMEMKTMDISHLFFGKFSDNQGNTKQAGLREIGGETISYSNHLRLWRRGEVLARPPPYH